MSAALPSALASAAPAGGRQSVSGRLASALPVSAPASWTAVRARPAALWTLSASLCLIILGVLAVVPTLTAFGVLLLGGLGTAYVLATIRAAALRTASRVVTLALPAASKDRPGSVAAAEASKVHVAGRSTEVTLTWHPDIGRPLLRRLVTTDALMSGAPGAADPSAGDIAILRPACAGPHAVLGVHATAGPARGMFAVEFFAPVCWRFQALPRASGRSTGMPIAAAKLKFRTSSGAISSARAGSGIELRELREWLPGDSFRHIDWKASGRMRRLIVRERDSDVTLSTYLVVDASATMRAGTPGGRSLDHAVEVAYTLARTLTRMRDSVGAVVVHGREIHVARAASGHRGMVSIVEALLAAVGPPTRSDPWGELDDDLARRVAGYLGHAEQLVATPAADPLESGSPHTMDESSGSLIHSRTGLGSTDSSRAELTPSDLADWLVRHSDGQTWFQELAGTAAGATGASWESMRPALHAFAVDRGLSVARRELDAPGAREKGLTDAFRRILAAPGGPHTVVVLSDLRGFEEVTPVSLAVRQLRKHGHQVLFAVVDASLTGPAPSHADLERAVRLLLHVEAQLARTHTLRAMSQAGAHVHFTAPLSDSTPRSAHSVGPVG